MVSEALIVVLLCGLFLLMRERGRKQHTLAGASSSQETWLNASPPRIAFPTQKPRLEPIKLAPPVIRSGPDSKTEMSIPLNGSTPIALPVLVREARLRFNRLPTRPEAWVRRHSLEDWLPAATLNNGEVSEAVIGIPLASRRCSLDSTGFEVVRRELSAMAGTLGRTIDWPEDVTSLMKNAQGLEQLLKEVDFECSVLLSASEYSAIPLAKVHEHAQALGLVLTDDGEYHWLNRDQKGGCPYHFRMKNLSPPSHFDETDEYFDTQSISFGFTPALSYAPLQVLDRMLLVAKFFAQRLGLSIHDDQDESWTETTKRESIRRIEEMLERLKARDLAAGDTALLRLLR